MTYEFDCREPCNGHPSSGKICYEAGDEIRKAWVFHNCQGETVFRDIVTNIEIPEHLAVSVPCPTNDDCGGNIASGMICYESNGAIRKAWVYHDCYKNETYQDVETHEEVFDLPIIDCCETLVPSGKVCYENLNGVFEAWAYRDCEGNYRYYDVLTNVEVTGQETIIDCPEMQIVQGYVLECSGGTTTPPTFEMRTVDLMGEQFTFTADTMETTNTALMDQICAELALSADAHQERLNNSQVPEWVLINFSNGWIFQLHATEVVSCQNGVLTLQPGHLGVWPNPGTYPVRDMVMEVLIPGQTIPGSGCTCRSVEIVQLLYKNITTPPKVIDVLDPVNYNVTDGVKQSLLDFDKQLPAGWQGPFVGPCPVEEVINTGCRATDLFNPDYVTSDISLPEGGHINIYEYETTDPLQSMDLNGIAIRKNGGPTDGLTLAFNCVKTVEITIADFENTGQTFVFDPPPNEVLRLSNLAFDPITGELTKPVDDGSNGVFTAKYLCPTVINIGYPTGQHGDFISIRPRVTELMSNPDDQVYLFHDQANNTYEWRDKEGNVYAADDVYGCGPCCGTQCGCSSGGGGGSVPAGPLSDVGITKMLTSTIGHVISCVNSYQTEVLQTLGEQMTFAPDSITINNPALMAQICDFISRVQLGQQELQNDPQQAIDWTIINFSNTWVFQFFPLDVANCDVNTGVITMVPGRQGVWPPNGTFGVENFTGTVVVADCGCRNVEIIQSLSEDPTTPQSIVDVVEIDQYDPITGAKVSLLQPGGFGLDPGVDGPYIGECKPRWTRELVVTDLILTAGQSLTIPAGARSYSVLVELGTADINNVSRPEGYFVNQPPQSFGDNELLYPAILIENVTDTVHVSYVV